MKANEARNEMLGKVLSADIEIDLSGGKRSLVDAMKEAIVGAYDNFSYDLRLYLWTLSGIWPWRRLKRWYFDNRFSNHMPKFAHKFFEWRFSKYETS